SIRGRTESFWKEVDHVKGLWKNRADLKVEEAGIAVLFGLDCFVCFITVKKTMFLTHNRDNRNKIIDKSLVIDMESIVLRQ
ncbi:unnamed protein product, partial [Brassica rapa subsp. narinosa]